jgi:dipeptidyl-peptidase-4
MWKAILSLVPMLTLAAQDAGRLTVESLYHPTRRIAYLEPPGSTFLWRPDGTLLEERSAKGHFAGVFRLHKGSFEATPLLDRAQFASALTAAGAADPADAGALAWNPARDAFAVKCGPDLFLVEVASGKARRLGSGEAPAFSPDGAWAAFLDGSDIRAVELATGKEVKVTTGGDATHFNGRLDWVYQEEVFGERGNPRAFWWSPDSRHIAYLSLDDSRVPVVTLMDDRTQPQKAVAIAYPKAGDPLPQARLGLADLEGQTTWMEDPYPGQDTLVTRVGFDPKGRVVAHFSDRIQSFNDCRLFDGPSSRTLIQERSRTWVDHAPLPLFLKDGRFLWQSARTGFSHLYLCDGQGRQTPVTQGAWDVRKVLGVDEAAGKVYFEATQRSAVGLDTYRADLEGSALRRLTETPGTHSLTFNTTFTAAVDRWSDVDTPPQDLVLDGEGVVLHRVPSAPSPALQAVRRGKVLFQQVKTRDGFPMETMLVLPVGFDPSRKYPVFHYVYGGPNTPLVKNAWNRNGLWFHFLAQQGIVTWICDNRSASAKGAAAHGIHRNLGAQELQDQLDSLEWLRAQGWADMNRIALHGYSYGGYLTAYALTHSKAWKLGIIGAPVTDWRLYDAVYTERYMGLPQDNAAGYDASSALKAADKLGGRIMLIHGTLDTNVHPQNSVQFLDALQKAGFNAPLILMPGSDHSPRAPQHQWAMYEGIWEFLKANL